MLELLRARLRRRRGRLAVMCAFLLLSATVATAHSSLADPHMGEAAAMCLAIVVGGAAVAAAPSLGPRLSFRRAAVEIGDANGPLAPRRWAPQLPRGDPAVLQVFRR